MFICVKLFISIEFQNKEYYWAGAMLGYCVIHGGPIPTFLSPFTYQLMVKPPHHVAVQHIQEVYDAELKGNLQNVSFLDFM